MRDSAAQTELREVARAAVQVAATAYRTMNPCCKCPHSTWLPRHLLACPAQCNSALMVFASHQCMQLVCDYVRLCRLWPDLGSIMPRMLGALTAPMVSKLVLGAAPSHTLYPWCKCPHFHLDLGHLLACPAQIYSAYMRFASHQSMRPIHNYVHLCRLWCDLVRVMPCMLGAPTAPMVSKLVLKQSPGGQQAVAHELCLRPEAHPPSRKAVCVGRRAGLLMSEVPQHICKSHKHTHRQVTSTPVCSLTCL